MAQSVCYFSSWFEGGVEVFSLAICAKHHYLRASLLRVSNVPESFHAAVIVISGFDDGGSISLDRYSFAPDLTELLN